MTATKYATTSVYTIVQSEKLAAMYKSGRKCRFREKRKWATAKRLLAAARKVGEIIPVIFAFAEETWDLHYFAELDDLAFTHNADGSVATTISVTGLTQIRSPRPKKMALRVCSTGRHLPEGFIRPYAIVETPSFVMKQTKR